MPQFEVEVKGEVEFEVFCSCGNGICNNSVGRNSRTRGIPQVVVEPCELCMERAKNDSYDKGHSEGYDEGYDKAREELDKIINDLKVELARISNATPT